MNEFRITALVVAALCLLYCLAILARTMREMAETALDAEERGRIDDRTADHHGNLQHTPLVRRGPGGEYDSPWPQD